MRSNGVNLCWFPRSAMDSAVVINSVKGQFAVTAVEMLPVFFLSCLSHKISQPVIWHTLIDSERTEITFDGIVRIVLVDFGPNSASKYENDKKQLFVSPY